MWRLWKAEAVTSGLGLEAPSSLAFDGAEYQGPYDERRKHKYSPMPDLRTWGCAVITRKVSLKLLMVRATAKKRHAKTGLRAGLTSNQNSNAVPMDSWIIWTTCVLTLRASLSIPW